MFFSEFFGWCFKKEKKDKRKKYNNWEALHLNFNGPDNEGEI